MSAKLVKSKDVLIASEKLIENYLHFRKHKFDKEISKIIEKYTRKKYLFFGPIIIPTEERAKKLFKEIDPFNYKLLTTFEPDWIIKIRCLISLCKLPSTNKFIYLDATDALYLENYFDLEK